MPDAWTLRRQQRSKAELGMWRWLVVGLVASAIAGCGDGRSRHVAVDTPIPQDPGSARITFDFFPGIDEPNRAAIQGAMEGSRAYFLRETGRDLTQDILVIVASGDPNRAPGYASGRKITLATGNDGWPAGNTPSSRTARQQLVAHELFHALQRDMLVTGAIRYANSPTWLVEGSAEYASYRYVADAGMADYDAIKRSLSRSLSPDKAAPLGLVVDYLTGADYDIAFLAVDRLAGEQGLRILGDYFVDAGSMDWREAFTKNFGRDVDSFVRTFEASRQPDAQ